MQSARDNSVQGENVVVDMFEADRDTMEAMADFWSMSSEDAALQLLVDPMGENNCRGRGKSMECDLNA